MPNLEPTGHLLGTSSIDNNYSESPKLGAKLGVLTTWLLGFVHSCITFQPLLRNPNPRMLLLCKRQQTTSQVRETSEPGTNTLARDANTFP